MLTVKHSVDGAPDVMIVKNEYNELGQLIDKKLHSTDGGTTFAQSVDQRYNIRGWLTKINEADVSAAASGDPGYDYFGMELVYNGTASGLSTTAMYNGNISAMLWSKGNGGSVGKQAYTFKYDPMSRLEEATHFDHVVAAWQTNKRSFQEKIHQYDLNGNIIKLSRRGFAGTLMDSLQYSYTGNRLNYVHDDGNQIEGFINTNTGTDDYEYDLNGNQDKDKNKGLANKGSIKYNHLNLPYEITKGTESIRYIYDATGHKLAQEVYSNSGASLVKYTDYIGELVYEGNDLKFMHHLEGRALPDSAGWEYQYHLKDHLGNVRVTFTTKPEPLVNYTANLETGASDSGQSDFGNYTSTNYDLVDHTDAGTMYQGVQWLNGGASGRVGLTKSLSVMPGDRINVTAYAKYMNLSGSGNPNAFATALTAAFGVSSASTGEQLTLYNSLNNYALGVAGGVHAGDDDTAPKAFITILLFDRNFNLLDAAWDQVTTDLKQISSTSKEPFGYPLSKDVTVKEAGYAYIFLSNEHPTYVDVYFDDLTVSHITSPIVSSSDYFPFGLSYNVGEKEGAAEQRNLYSGKELQDELSLNWYDYGARMYMPEIGRWSVIDPLSDAATAWTPYRYGFNNPITFTDPDGRFEYSDGYSTMDTRNLTASVSFSGTFVGNEGDLEMGSSASSKVFASAANGNSVEVRPGDFQTSNNSTEGTNGATSTPKFDKTSASYGFAKWRNDQSNASQTNTSEAGINKPDPWQLKQALAFAAVISVSDGPLPIADAVGIGVIAWAIVKYQPDGVQYTLRARTNGLYPVLAWGSLTPKGTKYLRAGDIWKIGETIQYDRSSNTQWRYTDAYLTRYNVNFIAEFTGTKMEILFVQQMKLAQYRLTNYGALPPGNKMLK